MLNCSSISQEFGGRILIVRQLLNATHLDAGGNPPAIGVPDVSREARGLAIVLLYAAYESLLRSTARSLLEVARSLRVGNRRLQPGFQIAAAYSHLQAISAIKESGIWKQPGLGLVVALFDSRQCTIDATRFPDTGDNFKRAQVTAFCDLFGLGDPAPILREAWSRLDTIVTQRNQIAHGQETPTEIGRRYSERELTNLVDVWEARWSDFIRWAETQGTSRDLYRRPNKHN